MIRILCADLSGMDEQAYAALWERAHPERRAQAQRYRMHADAQRCLAADALLRRALGTDDYTVEKTPSGKPFVVGRERFFYNLSHSGERVVIAYGESEVGVDIERHRPDADAAAIARRFFAPEEERYVMQDAAGMLARFYEIWTAKESYVKYLGTGLRTSLSSFSVLSPAPGVCFHRPALADGYSLCLCAEEDSFSLELLCVRQLLSAP
ncbi:MAG: 4'-phosphopantetheinyl transferase superfamily protein [Eubacteriales bacterium]|nr:4'-phosphopantetheinyl transferase superfamily protein [Eubacteriales bacterium]